MSREQKSADEIMNEKIEERGWNEMYQYHNQKDSRYIEPLDMTEDEYIAYSKEVAIKAIENQDPNLCEEYFELQRRAVYGNHYNIIKDMEELEEQMWILGTGEKIENSGPKLH